MTCLNFCAWRRDISIDQLESTILQFPRYQCVGVTDLVQNTTQRGNLRLRMDAPITRVR
jgi:hypothetical protein